MKKILLIAGIVLAVSTPSTLAEGLYLGASVGWSSVRNTLRGSVFDSDGTGYKAFLGYWIHEVVAVEGSYTDLGKFTGTSGTSSLRADARAYAVWGMARFPLGEIFSVWVKLGLAKTQVDLTLAGPFEAPSTSNREDNDLSWGIGVAANVGERVTIRAEWEEYMGESADKIQYGSVGIQFNF